MERSAENRNEHAEAGNGDATKSTRNRLSHFPGVLVPAATVIGGFILIGAEFMETFRILNPDGVAVAVVDGIDRHGFSLGLVGLLGIGLALVATLTGSRPAAVGVLGAGVAALVLIAAIDIPDIGASSLIEDPNTEITEGRAEVTSGFWVSLVGAGFLAAGGGLMTYMLGRDGET